MSDPDRTRPDEPPPRRAGDGDPGRARGHRFLVGSVGGALALSVGGIVARRLGGGPESPDQAPAPVATQRVTVRGRGGARIRAERSAGGPGTIVFTHGWCLNRNVWVNQVRALAARPHATVTWDLPGHGDSVVPKQGGVTLDLAVESLARVIDEATAGPIVLVGHSLGGMVTLSYLAANPRIARERVRGMVLVSTPLRHVAQSVAGRWPGAWLEAQILHTGLSLIVNQTTIDRVLAAEMGRGGLGLSSGFVRAGFGARPSAADVRFIRDVIATVPREVRAQTFRAMWRYDLGGALDDLDVPALVLWGTKDRLVNPVETRTIAQRLPRARGLEFPGAGHALFLERMTAFNREVGSFARARLRVRERSGQGVGVRQARAR